MDEIIRPLTIAQTYDWLEVTAEIADRTLKVRVKDHNGPYDHTTAFPLSKILAGHDPILHGAKVEVHRFSSVNGQPAQLHLLEFTEAGIYRSYHGTINLLTADARYRIEITRPGEGAIAKTEWTEVKR